MAPDSRRRTTWLGFAELVPTSRGTVRLHLRWRRLAALFGCMLVIGYFSAALGVFWLYKERKGYSEVAFSDVLFWKRAKIRQEQGAADIARGLEAIEAGAFREAFNYLRTGLGRAPDHLQGRLLLSQIYARSHPHLTGELFEQGLPYHADDPGFLQAYCRFLFESREDDQLLAMVREAIPSFRTDVETTRTLALFGMHAAIRNGRFAEAAEFFRRHDLGQTSEGLLQATQALEPAGHTEAAITLLEQALTHPATSRSAALYRRLIELKISVGRPDQAIAVALDLALLAPLEWQPRLLLLNAYEAAGREADIERETAALLRQFHSEIEAVAAIANFAQRTARIGLARRTYETALENGFAPARFGLLYIETHLRAGAYSTALELCREIEAEQPAWLTDYLPQFNAIRAIASFAVDDREVGNLYRRQLIEATGRNPQLLYSVGQSFQRAGLPEEAIVILREAHRRAPGDERILAKLIELQIATGHSGELPEHLAVLLQLRRPDYSVLRQAAAFLAEDRSIDSDKRLALIAQLEAVLREVEGPAPGFSI